MELAIKLAKARILTNDLVPVASYTGNVQICSWETLQE